MTNDKGEVTYFAFTRRQTKEIAKIIKTQAIQGKEIESLNNQYMLDSIRNRELELVKDSLIKVVDKFTTITVQNDSINSKNNKIILNLEDTIKGLDGNIKRKNKTIVILVGTNILMVLLIVLLTL